MRAILINPKDRGISEVEISDAKLETLKDAMSLAHQECMACHIILENEDQLLGDDNGRFKDEVYAFDFEVGKDTVIPDIPGNCLIIGTDDEGEAIDCLSTVEELEALITWKGDITNKPIPQPRLVNLDELYAR